VVFPHFTAVLHWKSQWILSPTVDKLVF
jgi:hypothetical protein